MKACAGIQAIIEIKEARQGYSIADRCKWQYPPFAVGSNGTCVMSVFLPEIRCLLCDSIKGTK